MKEKNGRKQILQMRFGPGDWKSRQQLRNLPAQVGFQPLKSGFADAGVVSTAVFCDICLHPKRTVIVQNLVK